MPSPSPWLAPESAARVVFHVAASTALIFGLCATRAESAQLPLTATVPAVVALHQAVYVAAAPAGTPMHLVVSLPLRQPAALDALLQSEIYNPASPMYHHYLSVAQFSAAFSPSERDILTAARFFAARGLTVSGLTPNHLLLDVAGPAAAVERVFHVRLGLYRHPTEQRLFIAPDREPTLDLGLPVEQVIGLDNFILPAPRVVRAPDVALPRVGSGPGGQYIGTDMRTAYYPTGTLTGAGQSIGLMELVGYNIADVQNFFNNGYGPSNSVKVVGVRTDSEPLSCTGSCDDTEQALDIEYAISIAPGLSSVRVYVGDIPEDVLNAEASDNISKVLSTSWGWSERFATDDALFKEFAAQGQTNLTASGDYSTLKASGPWPEEDANIVAVGGTDVNEHGPGGAWSFETGWAHSAGGPSTDKHILIESYQAPFINSANGGSTTLRNVPDVAANANTDMELCADGTCTGGYGGTSFASPMWAGIVALANQQAASDGKPNVGFINPAIYALAGRTYYTTWFHDEVKGKSGKFACTPSYDLVTGLGSPKGQAFINALVAQ
jgi:subtilase family serine protease